MSKFGKFKEIFAIGSAVAKPFVPGAAGTMLDVVTKGLDSHGAGGDALKDFAKEQDEVNHNQDEAILALHERVKALENK